MKQQQDSALGEMRRPVIRLIQVGVGLGGIGALTTLVPFIGIAELGRILLNPEPIDGTTVSVLAVIVVAGLGCGWTCTGVALWLTHVADDRLQANLRRALVKKLGQVPLGWYSNKTSGVVRKAVQDDLNDLHHLVAHHDVELVAAIALPLGGLGYLLWLDWRLALLAVATLPIYLIAYGWMMRGFTDKMVQLDTSFARVSAAIVEFIHGIAVVKVFGQTGRAHVNYQRAVGDFSDLYAGWARPLLQLEALTSLALSVPVIILVSLTGGSWLIAKGWVGPIDLLAETLVAVVIPQTLLTLTQGLTAQHKAVAAAQRIATLLATPSLPISNQPRLPQGAEVRFERVSFSYDGVREVLHDVDLCCQPGTVTALVGSSGAGKSTLAKLVPRFYDVTGGVVLLGGVDVRDIAPEVLYRHVGLVLQDARLLHGTVADNLRLGRPGASEAEMTAAARTARIHNRILALHRGYDSVIGEDAVFSGGEAQRLSIARMLLVDTPVLILDEATAHTDPELEAQIQDALSAVARGRTVLVIAHRLATITGVDQIVVLDGGLVAECGSHYELLTANGLYARMWRTDTDGGVVVASTDQGREPCSET